MRLALNCFCEELTLNESREELAPSRVGHALLVSEGEPSACLHLPFPSIELSPSARSPARAKSQTYSASRGIRSGRHWYFPEDSEFSVGILVSIASRAAWYTS